MSGTALAPARPAPLLGADTASVLVDMLASILPKPRS